MPATEAMIGHGSIFACAEETPSEYVALAEVFLGAGDAERARFLFERGLDLLIEHGKGYAIEAGRRLAELLEQEGDTAGALQVLKRATEAASSSPVGERV